MAFFRAALIAASLALPLAAADAVLLPDETDASRDKRFLLLEAGSAVDVGGDLGLIPQIGIFQDLSGAWQVGGQARVAAQASHSAYDYLPQASVSVRKLWLGDEDAIPIRNSEYFSATAGGFFAHDFTGKTIGLRPYVMFSLGKYWMPFEARPLGLDLSVDLTRYLAGYVSIFSRSTYITLGANVFYAIP